MKEEIDLADILNSCVKKYNTAAFILQDPISIPHQFTKKQDIEIAGLFAAILSWGNRTSIIRSCNKLLNLMDNAPYDFIMGSDLERDKKSFKKIKGFVHRTFNEFDLWHLLLFLQHHYKKSKLTSLESAFIGELKTDDETIEVGLIHFHQYVFNFNRTAQLETHCKKHIASPHKKSACKRLNMYLRWMVRQDKQGVDFGLWKKIKPSQLVVPLDVHVTRVAMKLALLDRKQQDWIAATELTKKLKAFDPIDPVKYDFALFGLGVMEKFK